MKRNTVFTEVERSAGMSNTRGLIADVMLRGYLAPASCHIYDPVHIIFSNGTVHTETFMMLTVARDECNISFKSLQDLTGSDWTWPVSNRAASAHVASLFIASRGAASSIAFKAMAGETPLVLPLLRYLFGRFLSTVPSVKNALASFLVVSEVADAVLQLKSGYLVDAGVLKLAVQKRLVLFKQAHGDEWLLPKHHFAQHMVSHCQRDRRILDC